MFIDYLTLMLINTVAGLALLAGWIFLDVDTPRARRWVPAFLMVGLIALVTGLHMIFTWPLPGAFNIAYGEMSVFFGILMLGLALTLALDLDLLPISIYATFVGLAAVLIGAQVLNLGMTNQPVLAGASFIWMGLIGLFAVPMLRLRGSPAFRVFGALGLAVGVVLWGVTGYMAYWSHLEGSFQKWKPISMQYEIEMNSPQPQPAPTAQPQQKQ